MALILTIIEAIAAIVELIRALRDWEGRRVQSTAELTSTELMRYSDTRANVERAIERVNGHLAAMSKFHEKLGPFQRRALNHLVARSLEAQRAGEAASAWLSAGADATPVTPVNLQTMMCYASQLGCNPVGEIDQELVEA